jgi:hypothetical protein
MFRRLLFVHRWLGVMLGALFFLWYLSGIGMMYWGMPAISARDRLERWPALEPARVVLSPQEAAARIDLRPSPTQVRLNTLDGRPVYRFGAGRDGDGGRVVYADTGEEHEAASEAQRDRAAAAWTGLRRADARVEAVTEIDQWMVGNRLRNLRPLWKYSWPNGEDVYIGESGDVLLHTTRTSRLAAYVSAVPHWLYFTPLRKHQPFWIRFATYSAMVGTAGAIIGLGLGVWLSARGTRYQATGAPSRIPYRGQKRLHTIFGLIFGISTITWTFSGSLAFLPFPQPPPPQGQRPPQRPRFVRDGNASVAAALRGRVAMDAFEGMHPRDLIARHAGLGIKELELTSFDGDPLVAAHLGDGTRRTMSLDGRIVDELDRARIIDIVKAAAPDGARVETRIVDQYDAYYLDRLREQPLPVILALMHDAEETRYYIDPKTATIVRSYSNRSAPRRWLYNGLHSLNFPWLYNHRPLWDIVVIAFMLGGAVLSATSLVLGWRVIGRTLRRLSPAGASPAVMQRTALGSRQTKVEHL